MRLRPESFRITPAGWLAAAAVALFPVAAPACTTEPGARYAAARALDGETILLDDGQEVRLAGVLTPTTEIHAATAQDGPLARDATRALQDMIAGRVLELRHAGRRKDRYGRLLAQVYVDMPDDRLWVQQQVIRSGHARAYALPGEGGCLQALVAEEAEARARRLGLWRHPQFAVKPADDIQGLLRDAGRFAIVEGRVAAVAHRGRETFLNFGEDWRRDFTVAIARKAAGDSREARARLDALAGRSVRVRGWIERRNGPLVAVGSLDEIETLDAPAAQSAPP